MWARPSYPFAMSLSTNSALRRILDEAREVSLPAGAMQVARAESSGQMLEVRRSSFAYEPPFATSLHFWAHALRALLQEHGRGDAFDALAVNCLCKSVPGAEVAPAFDALSRRLEPAFEIPSNTSYRSGYLMIEQEVLVSWVAERSEEFVALFWVRPSWLSSAKTVPRE